MILGPKIGFLYRALMGPVWSLVISIGSLAADLPDRKTPIPETTDNVPHVQLNVTQDPAFSEILISRISELPGVFTTHTANSLSGARGFRLRADIEITRPQSLLGGREFAHLHKDGSLHAFLPTELARQAIKKGWGTRHPWAGQNPGWDGFIMIYTPSTVEELDTVEALVKASYIFVTEE